MLTHVSIFHDIVTNIFFELAVSRASINAEIIQSS